MERDAFQPYHALLHAWWEVLLYKGGASILYITQSILLVSDSCKKKLVAFSFREGNRAVVPSVGMHYYTKNIWEST